MKFMDFNSKLRTFVGANQAEIGVGGKSRKIQSPGVSSCDLSMSQLEFTYCNLWRVHVGSSQKGHKELPSPCCLRHLIDFIYIIFVGGLYDSGQIMSPQMIFFPLIKRIQMILYSRCMPGFSKKLPQMLFSGEPGEFGHFARDFMTWKKLFALGVETPRKWMSWLIILKIDVFPIWKNEWKFSIQLAVCQFSYKYIGYPWFGWQNKWNPASYLIGWHSRLPEVRY